MVAYANSDRSNVRFVRVYQAQSDFLEVVSAEDAKTRFAPLHSARLSLLLTQKAKGSGVGARTSGEELLEANQLLEPLRVANQPNNMYGSNGSVQNILNSWGVGNSAYSSASSWSSVVADINANRPFVIRYGWTNGGGHIMVGRGYESMNGVNYLYIMNPWPGEGQTYRSYSSAVSASDHKWTHTQRMNING